MATQTTSVTSHTVIVTHSKGHVTIVCPTCGTLIGSLPSDQVDADTVAANHLEQVEEQAQRESLRDLFNDRRGA